MNYCRITLESRQGVALSLRATTQFESQIAIGTHEDVDIQLPRERFTGVARHHVHVFPSAEGVFWEDSKTDAEVELKPGEQVLTIGSHEFSVTLEIADQPFTET